MTERDPVRRNSILGFLTTREFLLGYLIGTFFVAVLVLSLLGDNPNMFIRLVSEAFFEGKFGAIPSFTVLYFMVAAAANFLLGERVSVGLLAAFAVPIAFLFGVYQYGLFHTGYSLRDKTDREVAIAQQEDWFSHHLDSPSDADSKLFVLNYPGGSECKARCMARLLRSSDLAVVGSIVRWGSAGDRERVILLRKGVTEDCAMPTTERQLIRIERHVRELNEWLSKNEFTGICASLAKRASMLPYILVEYSSWAKFPDDLARRGGISGAHSVVAVVTEFTHDNPEGRLLGRWEYGFFPNERNVTNRKFLDRFFFERLVRWKRTGPHGTPFTLQDVITELMGPGYVIEFNR